MTESDTPGRTGGDQALYESERNFRLLVQGVTDYAICMLDPQGIVTSWNAGAERIKGYKAAEIIGRHFGTFYTPEDRILGLPAFALATALREGKFETEGWRMRRDGTRFLASVVIDPIYEDGRLVGFAKVTRDISERQHAQDTLRESERQFRLLVGGVTDYALYMLDPDGRVTSWNAGGQRIKGYRPEEIIGQEFSKFYTPADRKNGKPARALQIAREAGRYEEEGWRVRKDGSFFWASVVIDPIRDDDGTLIGFAKITRDITERREAQAELQRVQSQLAESQKMDALGQLTGGVAHDFNNLLMIVSGHIQTIKKQVEGQERAMRAAQAIETATQRGAALTRQLLSFARRQRVNPRPVNVAERIDSMRDVLGSGLGPVELKIEADPNLWPIQVDIAEFEIALVNLIVNARDAMPQGGTVTLTMENMRSEDGADTVAVTIHDRGVGIPADVVDRVFDPFFTTKPVGKGTGLGLSQVHGFVHQAGGTVRIRTALDEGTSVTMFFPRAADPTNEIQAADTAGATGNVLLVEDNPDVASASTVLLEQLGYAVRWAPDANAALRELEVNGIDLVFSDIVMPGPMDGIGLARLIRDKYPGLPVLLATGYSERMQELNDDFPLIRKPYEIHELGQMLARLR
jgi:PAS domain S-box-containing protein